MKPVILFRKNLAEENEFLAAKHYFHVVEQRTHCEEGSLVICRYSCLPYYKELESDLHYNNCDIINSYEQHRWIASFDYYNYLKDFTPETWTDETFCYAPEGQFVVKGKTNSRKHQWKSHMFAKDKQSALEIASVLINDDAMISEQGIVYRRFVPLKVHEIGMNGLPFSNEFRFFYLGTKCLAYGYYWSIADDPAKGQMTEEGLAFADKIASIASQHVNFFVVDVAEKADGGWILIEINDAQMSGISMIDPHKLYLNLKESL